MTTPRSSSAVDSVKLYFFSSNDTARSAGCPYTTIALLTGEDPWALRARYKSNPTMTSKVMVKHLKALGFKVKQITDNSSLDLLKDGKGFTNAHVIVATVRMTAHEASWVVFYGGVMWHNFDPVPTSYITSLSFPLVNAFVLFLPEWDYCEIETVRQKRLLEEAKLFRKLTTKYEALQNPKKTETTYPKYELSVSNLSDSNNYSLAVSREESNKNRDTDKRNGVGYKPDVSSTNQLQTPST